REAYFLAARRRRVGAPIAVLAEQRRLIRLRQRAPAVAQGGEGRGESGGDDDRQCHAGRTNGPHRPSSASPTMPLVSPEIISEFGNVKAAARRTRRPHDTARQRGIRGFSDLISGACPCRKTGAHFSGTC